MGGEKQKGYLLTMTVAKAMGGASPAPPSSSSRKRRRRSCDELAAEEAHELTKGLPLIDRKTRRKIDGDHNDGKKQAEGDDDSVSSNRVSKLKEIIRILEELHSSLRRRISKEEGGDVLTFGEQRLYNLIYCHVHNYIFLYHLEQRQDHKDMPLFQAFPFHKGDILPDPMEFEDALEKLGLSLYTYFSRLLKCRRSFPESGEVENPGLLINTFEEMDYNDMQHIRNQRLLDILHTLEVLGHSRAYAPPMPGEEIRCYKDIRKRVTSSLTFATAKHGLDEAAGSNKKSRGFPGIPQLDERSYGPYGLCCGPPAYQFSVAFELISEYRSLLDEYKLRISPQNITEPHQATAPTNNDVVAGNQNVISPIQLAKWEPKKSPTRVQRSAVQTRLDCLKIITSKLGTIQSFNEKPPTQKERRLCVLIAEHVRSSHWLSDTVWPTEMKEGSCEVDVADIVSDNYGLLDARSGQLHLGGDNDRERCLDEITSYLRACKLSCLAEIPTREEVKQYSELARVFGPVLTACLGSEPTEDDLVKADDDTKNALRQKLFCIYKSAQGFLNVLEAELHRILSTVHSSACLEGVVSLDEVLRWSTVENEEMKEKLSEFFGEPVAGRMDRLDQAILWSLELYHMGTGIFMKLGDAIKAMYVAWRMDEDYNMVEKEVDNALDVLVSEKPFSLC